MSPMSSQNLTSQFVESQNGFLVRHHIADPTRQPGTHSNEPHPCVNEAEPLRRHLTSTADYRITKNVSSPPAM
jgi:hypothetical protein